jgi:hypothetical protein
LSMKLEYDHERERGRDHETAMLTDARHP